MDGLVCMYVFHDDVKTLLALCEGIPQSLVTGGIYDNMYFTTPCLLSLLLSIFFSKRNIEDMLES